MVHETSPHNDPQSLADVMRQVMHAGLSGNSDETRKLMADQLSATNLLRGEAEILKSQLSNPDADVEDKQAARENVWSAEHDLLNVDPDAHRYDQQIEPTSTEP